MRTLTVASLLVLANGICSGADKKPPIYLWLEPEWFEGVKGNFAYWPGPGMSKPTGSWGIAGPGISAEWSQGGESEWNSMGVPAEENKAECHRTVTIPRAGKYKLWVRYVDHRKQTEPFTVRLEQNGKPAINGALGIEPVVPPNDEYQLYWGFSFGWGALEGQLAAGQAKLSLIIDKPGQAWRQVDAVLITDDLEYVPAGREKPPFAYFDSFKLFPPSPPLRGRGVGGEGVGWRGKGLPVGASWKRPPVGGRDFSMWTQIDADPKWWSEQKVENLTPYDLFFQFSPPHDIRAQFHKQFAGRKDLPIMSWPHLLPGLYLGQAPDLSPESPVRKWLERTKSPFYILTNYAGPQYSEKTGPATYQALAGPLAGQFLGYIHGEAIGTQGVTTPDKPLAADRRVHVDALGSHFKKQQAETWSKIYKTAVPEDHWAKGISCLSVDSIALAHLFHESGAKVVGYEEDATNIHVPMRIAFERGAARQYGGAWINYASGNFGDCCNYFTQQHMGRGAPAWFHSKYAITDGVTATWYRKLYYLNYLGGASAIFWEQGLGNQWFLPGPGTHPVQLTPFGRATEDFQAFVTRLPDRGEPYTPVGILLSHGHGYERVNYVCKMLHHFPENDADRELRELFNVCWYPSPVLEALPAAPDVQSMPSGIYGDIFDVLVDRPNRAKALFDYPVVIAAGDVELGAAMRPHLEEYVKKGGTLVLNGRAVLGDRQLKLSDQFLGLALSGTHETVEGWIPEGGAPQPSTPYRVYPGLLLEGTQVLAWAKKDVPLITRRQVGEGAVILTLCPRMLGEDERAHPALPYLMNGLTAGLSPVEVRLANGEGLAGEIMHSLNRTKDGWLVTLINNRGVDKTPSGIARVNRRAFTDVVLRTKLPVKSVKEYTQPRDLAVEKKGDNHEIRVRVHPGDVQVVGIVRP